MGECNPGDPPREKGHVGDRTSVGRDLARLVAPITSTDRNIDWHVRIPADDETGLKSPSVILTDQIRATNRVRFKKKYGRASPDVMAQVKEELLDLLELVDI